MVKKYLKKNFYKKKFIFKNIDSKNCIPWFTLPSVKFLNFILKKNYTVFEYGSGSSTYFFSRKCKKVYSVEYYENFYKKLKKKLNINFIHHNFSGYSLDRKAKKILNSAISKTKDAKYNKKTRIFCLSMALFQRLFQVLNTLLKY